MNPPLLVLSPHRAGSSATMGLLASAGLHIGKQIRTNDENPKGFFESEAVLQAHIRILRSMDRDWTCPPARMDLSVVDHRLVAEAIEEVTSSGSPVGVKDPRLLFMLPAWLPHIEAVRLLGVVRAPQASAASLVRRDGFPLGVARQIGDLYEQRLAVLQDALGFPIVDFDSRTYLEDVERLAGRLGLRWDRVVAKTFYEPGLIHHRSSAGEGRWRGLADLPVRDVPAAELSRALELLPVHGDLPQHRGPALSLRRHRLWDRARALQPHPQAVLDIRPVGSRTAVPEMDAHPAVTVVQLDPVQRAPAPLVSTALGHDVVLGPGLLDVLPTSRLGTLFESMAAAASPGAVLALDGLVVGDVGISSRRWPVLHLTSRADAWPFHHQQSQLEGELETAGWDVAAIDGFGARRSRVLARRT